MDPDVIALFHELANRPPTEREACYAQRAVPAAVRAEVESLLRFDAPSAQSFTGDVAVAAENALRAASGLTAGTRYGSYCLIRLLGRGGMGAVYEAQQENPRRIVALKVINPGMAGPELLRRFELESQALGRLQHPGIAQIYEAGTADVGFGRQPYFAMELVRGEPLLHYANSHHLDTRQRLELMARICDAIDHAHQRGIIHRDLKPANIVVDETGQPKVLDFGVARVTDRDVQSSLQTDVGQLVGTLAYMSPEQVLADPLELDTRSDVYAFGVILYELLTGRLPYDTSGALPDLVRAIQTGDPTRLGTVSRVYRGDIEIIVAKALEKDKARRYGSAAALAADIRHYLHDEPIVARPPSTSYQLRKFAKRHKALVASVAAVFVVLLAGVIVSTWLTARARQAEQIAEGEAAKARAINEFLENDLLSQAATGLQTGANSKPNRELTVREALDRAAERIGERFKNQPLVEASLRLMMGDTYLDLGLPAVAEGHLRRAVDLRQRTVGAEHPEALAVMTDLAIAYHDQGKFTEAEKLSVTLLDAHRRAGGEEGELTLTAMNNLGILYRDMRKYALAEPLQSKVLDVRRRTLGEQHARTQVNMVNLALTYMDLGKYDAAEKMMARVVALRRRLSGEAHPNTLNSMRNLAAIYTFQGRYGDAERLLTTVREAQRRVRGDDHPDTLLTRNGMARVYAAQGRYDEAEAEYLRMQETARRALGEEHPDRILSMNNLANMYRQQRRDAESEKLFLRVLEIRRRVSGSVHPEMANTLVGVSLLRFEQRKYAESELLAREALAIFEKTWPDNWRRYNAQHLLAASLIGQNRLAEAEPLRLSASRELMQRESTIPAPDQTTVRQVGERIKRLYGDAQPASSASVTAVR